MTSTVTQMLSSSGVISTTTASWRTEALTVQGYVTLRDRAASFCHHSVLNVCIKCWVASFLLGSKSVSLRQWQKLLDLRWVIWYKVYFSLFCFFIFALTHEWLLYHIVSLLSSSKWLVPYCYFEFVQNYQLLLTITEPSLLTQTVLQFPRQQLVHHTMKYIPELTYKQELNSCFLAEIWVLSIGNQLLFLPNNIYTFYVLLVLN